MNRLITHISSHIGIQSNNDSFAPSITSSGRYGAFASCATNLISKSSSGKSSQTEQVTGQFDAISAATGGGGSGGSVACGTQIYLYDQELSALTRVSVSSNNTIGEGNSFAPGISAHGHYIVFASQAENLICDDGNQKTDIFLYDLSDPSLPETCGDSSPQTNIPADGGGGASLLIILISLVVYPMLLRRRPRNPYLHTR